jgi:hypothetical protein
MSRSWGGGGRRGGGYVDDGRQEGLELPRGRD